MEAVNEVDLAKRLLAGDEGAFEQFVEHFRRKLYQYTYLMCGQREDAEEVAQETLFKVFESFHQLKEPERIRSWVFRIARNFCYMKRRKSVFAPEKEISLDEVRPAFRDNGDGRKLEIADWSALPENRILNDELREVLHTSIAELPDIYKSVLMLRDVEELSGEETAEVLDISLDTVKTRLHRARLMLRKKLDAYLRKAEVGA
jgi:RNA polymerase sigma-70 factor (ECF subfamily)